MVRGSCCSRFRAPAQIERRLPEVDLGRRRVAHRQRRREAVLDRQQVGAIGVAHRHRLVVDEVEHRSELALRGVDRAQHLGCRRLLLQRLALVGQQAGVLHCQGGLRREGLDQHDLLVAERADFGAVQNEQADRAALADQRHHQDGADTHQLDGGHAHRQPIAIALGRRQVGNLDRPGVVQDTEQGDGRIDRLRPAPVVQHGRRPVALGGEGEMVVLVGQQRAERRLALRHRLDDDRVEHRREVAGRGVDSLQHLGQRSLPRLRRVALGQRLGELPPQRLDRLPFRHVRSCGHCPPRHRSSRRNHTLRGCLVSRLGLSRLGPASASLPGFDERTARSRSRPRRLPKIAPGAGRCR
jgi:hypothetical protein